MGERDVVVTLHAGVLAYFECPHCSAREYVSLDLIDREEGILVS